MRLLLKKRGNKKNNISIKLKWSFLKIPGVYVRRKYSFRISFNFMFCLLFIYNFPISVSTKFTQCSLINKGFERSLHSEQIYEWFLILCMTFCHYKQPFFFPIKSLLKALRGTIDTNKQPVLCSEFTIQMICSFPIIKSWMFILVSLSHANAHKQCTQNAIKVVPHLDSWSWIGCPCSWTGKGCCWTSLVGWVEADLL